MRGEQSPGTPGSATTGTRRGAELKAAVMYGVDQPLQIEDVEIDDPGPNEVLIKTSASGVCHSDLHFMEGKYPTAVPIILGHESAGVVEKVGSEVTRAKPGDRMVVAFVQSCGACDNCVQGKPYICDNSTAPRSQRPCQAQRQPDAAVCRHVRLCRVPARPRERVRARAG